MLFNFSNTSFEDDLKIAHLFLVGQRDGQE